MKQELKQEEGEKERNETQYPHRKKILKYSVIFKVFGDY